MSSPVYSSDEYMVPAIPWGFCSLVYIRKIPKRRTYAHRYARQALRPKCGFCREACYQRLFLYAEIVRDCFLLACLAVRDYRIVRSSGVGWRRRKTFPFRCRDLSSLVVFIHILRKSHKASRTALSNSSSHTFTYYRNDAMKNFPNWPLARGAS